jgi:3-oxoacyl-(acyl-carrier-protein) synthase
MPVGARRNDRGSGSDGYLGAAGALETVATALAINHEAAPLTLNFDSPAPGGTLDLRPRLVTLFARQGGA